MRSFNGTGVITRLNSREITKSDGTLTTVASMRIDVKDRVKINGSWENYHTCLQLDASAFGAAATFWLDHLHEGDPVEIKGDLRVEKFNKRDGTPGMSIILEGDNGNAPYVKWLPKGFTPKKEEQPAPQVSDSQVDDEEPPF